MIRYFASHPTAANLLMVAFLLLGLVALPTLQRETFPRISPKEVQVTVIYPGATTEDVVQAICLPLEDALDGIDNLVEIRCEARESRGALTAEMRQGADLNVFAADIKREVDAIDNFPAAAEDPIVEQLGRNDFVASIAVTGPTRPVDLKALAEGLKDRMLATGAVSRVEVQGFSDQQVRIEVDDLAARALGLSFADIAEALGRQNVDLPLGEIETHGGMTLLRFTDERNTVQGYRDLVITSAARGGQVRLGDIASVVRQFEDEEVKVTFDGRPAALLNITKSPEDDTLNVMTAVQSFLESERQRLPPSVELTLSRDGSRLVRDRLTLLSSNAAQGLALVFAVMWAFFGLRQAFWIAMGLPVSFMGALAAMAALGYSINMLTMVGLLIVIGILMDDAIVIAENIASQRQRGKSPLQAAIDGTRQVAPGIVASFLTTAAVFGSLAFLKGDLGEILSVVPVVMLLVLTVSLVEAFLILPNHLSHGAYKAKTPAVTHALERGIAHLRDRVVGPLARAAVNWRYLTVGVGAFFLLATVSLMAGGVVKFVAFPELDGDSAQARIQLRQGATLAQTEKAVVEIVAAAERVNAELMAVQPDNMPLIRHISVQYSENEDALTQGPHLATVFVDLLSAELRTTDMENFLQAWRHEVSPDLVAKRLNITEGQFGPAGRAIELRLRGHDLEQINEASNKLQAWLAGYRGAYNLADDLDLGKPEIRLSLKDGAGAVGLDARRIADQLRAAFHGVTADEIQARGDTIEIDVRLASVDRDSLGDLAAFSLRTATGEAVPLTAVVDIEPGRGYARLLRIDRQPTVTVTGDVFAEQANANEIVADTHARFLPELKQRHPDVTIGTEGQNAEADETQASMLRGLVLGLAAVYLLLAFQFRSYAEPIAVMSVVPFTLAGSVLGHVVMGIDFAMPSMLGMISLAGVVVNGSILLVNFMKGEHDPGVTGLAEIAAAAAMSRFRAILLTSITTIAGVVPLLFETSLQAQILIPLVTSIAFGLVAVSFLILFVVPAFYAILHDFRLTTL